MDEHWTLIGFERGLRDWIVAEEPHDSQWKTVARWVVDVLPSDPYLGARREPGFPTLWFTVFPDTLDARGRVAVISMFIDPATRTVRCDRFSTLTWPVWQDNPPDPEDESPFD